jgi:predicted dehydrogenase
MVIGIIGAENSHTKAYAKLINAEKRFEGVTVDYVWGETPELAKDASENGPIPNIVENSEDMLGKIDALIVDHRHAKYHLPAARPYVEAGIPTFIDKPFCYRAKEGKEFLALAREKGTPVTSYSVLPLQQTFVAFKEEMAGIGDWISGTTYGNCDLDSQYGGVFFYGVHQVSMVLEAFGYDAEAVLVTRDGDFATGSIIYPSGKVVTMGLIKSGAPGFGITAVGMKDVIDQAVKYDEIPYLTAVEMFIHMFRTGEEPLSHDEILKPVQVLEALEKSIASETVETIES